jgi:hypothetical protein
MLVSVMATCVCHTQIEVPDELIGDPQALADHVRREADPKAFEPEAILQDDPLYLCDLDLYVPVVEGPASKEP